MNIRIAFLLFIFPVLIAFGDDPTPHDWIKDLRSPSTVTRERAQKQLTALGEKARPALKAARHELDPDAAAVISNLWRQLELENPQEPPTVPVPRSLADLPDFYATQVIESIPMRVLTRVADAFLSGIYESPTLAEAKNNASFAWGLLARGPGQAYLKEINRKIPMTTTEKENYENLLTEFRNQSEILIGIYKKFLTTKTLRDLGITVTGAEINDGYRTPGYPIRIFLMRGNEHFMIEDRILRLDDGQRGHGMTFGFKHVTQEKLPATFNIEPPPIASERVKNMPALTTNIAMVYAPWDCHGYGNDTHFVVDKKVIATAGGFATDLQTVLIPLIGAPNAAGNDPLRVNYLPSHILGRLDSQRPGDRERMLLAPPHVPKLKEVF